jgi:nucleoid-associated protein YgaU
MKEVLIVVLVVVMLGVGAFNVAGHMVDKYVDNTAEHNLSAVETKSVTVDSGDTLWDYISMIENRDSYDGQSLVNLIQDVNDLNPSKYIKAGQVLEIPVTVKERTQE